MSGGVRDSFDDFAREMIGVNEKREGGSAIHDVRRVRTHLGRSTWC